jgi:DNA-directed RNA polymerase beta subunit
MSDNLKLAISKVGDLLLQDRITRDDKGNCIQGVMLKIPNYQRPYKWTAKNAIQLLDDIVDAKNNNKETYRVGTLILHYEKANSTYNIVDGQQRTITFSLLLKALGAETIKFIKQLLANNQSNRSNIPNNFRILSRRADNLGNHREKEDLLEYVKNNCELIVVITDDISEAFQFFDSQNARGKKLYPHDLLKAYHLREMRELDSAETEKIVKGWEDLPQNELSRLFSDYLFRIKEWTKGNKAHELTEHNINKFKGINQNDYFPYAQFFKGAFAYADMVNHSAVPFVTGMRNLKQFQLDTPIVAGKPFFEYAKHYYAILKDIQNNDKYVGYFINDVEIVKTLDLGKYKNGVGNRITRLLFDTAVLLYVDRFCTTDRPVKTEMAMFDQFVVFAFIWSYSLRAQYYNLGWLSAQNYIMGNEIINSFNIYKIITEADSPIALLSELSDRVSPLSIKQIEADKKVIDEKDSEGIFQNYLHFFKTNNFLIS